MSDQIQENINGNSSASGFEDLTVSFSTGRQTGGEKYVVFYLDDILYAVSAKQVVEVVQPPAVTPLPRVPEWCSGIANLRGNIISVVDLTKLWGIKPSGVSAPKSKLILLRSLVGKTSVAFAVDRLSEIVALPTAEIQPVEDADSSHLLGKIKYKSLEVRLPDAEKIFSLLQIGH